MADWQSITSAPKDGSYILVSIPIAGGKGMAVVQYNASSPKFKTHLKFPWVTIDGKGFAENGPTHWMPVPDDPK